MTIPGGGGGFGLLPPPIKCDFCSALNPPWIHPAEPFVMEKDGWASDDRWAACDTCHALIEAEDAGALAKRSLDSVPGGIPRALRPAMLDRINEMHAGFWRGRSGPAYRFGVVQDAQHRERGISET